MARFYDLDLLSDPGDLPFYLAAATNAGPILELACGSGRLAIPLAAAGHDLTGVDNDRAMLDRARRAWQANRGRDAGGKLTLIEHDMTTLELPVRFDLVFIALNSFLLLDGRAAQARALRVMRAHMAPGGRAVIDVWAPTHKDLELYDGRQVLDWVRTDPETGERIAKTWSATYDAEADTATISTTFETDAGDPVQRRDTIRFIGGEELLDLVREAGLVPEQVLGAYDGTAWSEASERVVLIAQGR